MQWKKMGKVFCASEQNEWMMSGGRAPVPMFIGNDMHRIYFASYDEKGRGRIFSLELNIDNPKEISNISQNPVVDIGNVGFYDDNGIIPSDIVDFEGKLYLYTIGFSLKNKVIFDAATGLAISDDNGRKFTKLAGPVLDRGVDDPCFAASPTVIKENGLWRMWYVSCDKWEPEGDSYKHFYNIKHKTSKDGIYWDNDSSICIDYEDEYEYAISRPTVIRENSNLYKMWYSYRASKNIKTYRIGYAESSNGLNWTRKDDEVGIDVSNEGWDSEMICYPYVFDYKGKRYMLYNGNGYGKTGFGLAVLEGK